VLVTHTNTKQLEAPIYSVGFRLPSYASPYDESVLHHIAHMLSMQTQERGQFKHIPRCWASSPVHALTCTMVPLPSYQQDGFSRSSACVLYGIHHFPTWASPHAEIAVRC